MYHINKANISDVEVIHALIKKAARKDELLPRSLQSIYENLRSFIVCRTENIRLNMFRLASAFVVSEAEKRVLIGIAYILFVAEYPPEHGDQFLSVSADCRENPLLGLCD